MKKFSYILVFILICSTMFASQKKILVEVFTNSHCPLCPPAHSVINAYMQNGLNKDNVTYIFYHMVFPYPDDPLNLANQDDPAERNAYYGNFSSTPRGIFDGQVQSGNYAGWGNILDTKASEDSPFELSLSRNGISNRELILTATIKQTSAASSNNLVIYFVAVENVDYQGRNGISDNFNVMRKMFPGPNGKQISVSLNQTAYISENISINESWNLNELGFVVFIQDQSSKTVYQSEYRTYNSLITTNVEESDNDLLQSFALYQNYPNPFNPTTNIEYRVGRNEHVILKVYDVLGNEVATLVDGYQQPGRYKVSFNRQRTTNKGQLSSGIYFYTLRAGNYSAAKKFILMK